MPDLAIHGVTKRFGAVTALSDVSLDIRAGELVTLLGPSGCGKSTLLRIVAGLEQADAGTISVGGRPLDPVPPKDRGVAFVFQSYALYPHLTAYQNIAAPLVMRELGTLQRVPLLRRLVPGTAAALASIDGRVRETAELLRVTPLLDRRPAALSGGQRQRVALGRAIVRAPQLFLMDEPFANLDAGLRIHMRGEIARLQRRLGTTTLFVTHDQAEAMALSDRIAVMFGGEIRQFAAARELCRDPADLEVARFLTQPRLNEIPVPAPAGGLVVVGDRRLAVPDAEGVGEAGVLGFRPEHARLVRRDQGGVLPVSVERVEPGGADAHVFLLRPGTDEPLVVRTDADTAAGLAPGAALGLEIDAARAWFFPGGARRRMRAFGEAA